jgi:hypothetical protein
MECIGIGQNASSDYKVCHASLWVIIVKAKMTNKSSVTLRLEFQLGHFVYQKVQHF